jgi:hypothetical protein
MPKRNDDVPAFPDMPVTAFSLLGDGTARNFKVDLIGGASKSSGPNGRWKVVGCEIEDEGENPNSAHERLALESAENEFRAAILDVLPAAIETMLPGGLLRRVGISARIEFRSMTPYEPNRFDAKEEPNRKPEEALRLGHLNVFLGENYRSRIKADEMAANLVACADAIESLSDDDLPTEDGNERKYLISIRDHRSGSGTRTRAENIPQAVKRALSRHIAAGILVEGTKTKAADARITSISVEPDEDETELIGSVIDGHPLIEKR